MDLTELPSGADTFKVIKYEWIKHTEKIIYFFHLGVLSRRHNLFPTQHHCILAFLYPLLFEL